MEPIAIIGIGCRFPQAENPQAFWQLLRNGIDAIVPVPKERWDIEQFYNSNPNMPGKMNTCWGGFIEEVDRFDADFFGMSAEEVEHSDPQQRLFLEVAWEALENANIVPTSLTGSQTGVFIGLCTIDYHRLLYKNFASIGPYSGIGTTPCITANRLSYLLDLRGPSMAIDTACSSSLVTVHLACQSLRSKESDLCLVGGVNLILSPDSTISSSQTGLLSPEGRCKSFDANADGYVRGEGCGVLVLKRLCDVFRDGNKIFALIKGSAVKHNGLSNSISSPNGLAQQAVMRQALKNADVRPSQINYVDAHAVGTAIGDAIEFKAIMSVLMEDRKPDQPCWIGSVKPNIGHLEAAAGISALIKVVLSLQNEEIPPHLHFNRFNPYISLNNNLFSIPTEIHKWSRNQERRFAGVSAFSFGGTNAHVILEEAPIQEESKKEDERPQHLFTLSAKSEIALEQLAQKYDHFLASETQISLANVCLTANTGRIHFNHRLCLVTESILQLRQKLKAFIAHQKTDGLWQANVKGRKRPKIAFFFPDESSEYLSLGRQLYQTQPTFRRAIAHCGEIFQLYLEKPLLKDLYSDTQKQDSSILLGHGECASVLFATEYALAKLWQSWGIKPKVVMGYGTGEYIAATIAGVFSLEDAIKMFAQSIAPASQLPTTRVNNFTTIAKETVYSQPKIPIISSLFKEQITKEIATPEYWCRHWQQLEKIPVGGDALTEYPVVLVMGSKPILTNNTSNTSLWLSSLSPEQDDWQEILHSLGELYVRGIEIDWSGFDQDYSCRSLQLPTYPFQRQRYWFKTTDKEQQEQTQKIA